MTVEVIWFQIEFNNQGTTMFLLRSHKWYRSSFSGGCAMVLSAKQILLRLFNAIFIACFQVQKLSPVSGCVTSIRLGELEQRKDPLVEFQQWLLQHARESEWRWNESMKEFKLKNFWYDIDDPEKNLLNWLHSSDVISKTKDASLYTQAAIDRA